MGSNPIFRSRFQIQDKAPGCPWGLYITRAVPVCVPIHPEKCAGVNSDSLAAVKLSSKRRAGACCKPGVDVAIYVQRGLHF